VTWSLVQSPAGVSQSSSATSTVVSFGSNNTQGNGLIAYVTFDISAPGAVAQLSDTKGNTWQMAPSAIGTDTPGTQTTQIWIAENCKADTGTPNQVTVKYGSNGTTATVGRGLIVEEWHNSNGPVANTADGGSGGIGTATTSANSISAGSVTTTADGDLVVVGIERYVTRTITAGTGYTLGQQTTSDEFTAEHQVQTTHGSISGTATSSGTTGYVAAMAAFKAPTGSTPVTLPDGGAGVDSSLASATVPLADAGSATEATGVTAVGSAGDTGHASESSQASVVAPLADGGRATESISIVETATPEVDDTGSAQEGMGVVVQVSLEDFANADDVLAVQGAAAPQFADGGSCADTIAIVVELSTNDTATCAEAIGDTDVFPLPDVGQAVDTLMAEIELALNDTAVGADSVSVSGPPGTPVHFNDAGFAVDSLTVVKVTPSQGGTGVRLLERDIATGDARDVLYGTTRDITMGEIRAT